MILSKNKKEVDKNIMKEQVLEIGIVEVSKIT
jgi:hypothetical protein